MPTYRRRVITEPQTEIPLDPLRGSRYMNRARASAVHGTGDRVLAHGRRILARVGLHGASQWQVSDTAIGGTMAHPSPTDERVTARTPALKLTPGHFLRAQVLAAPSGMTSKAVDTIPVDSGHLGKVKISVTYNNGVDTTVDRTISIPASVLEDAAQPTGSGAAWGNLYRRRTSPLYPVDIGPPGNLAEWCDGLTATITISYIGSPRVLDCVVFEEPFAVAYDVSSSGWAVPLHADPAGHDLGQLTGPVPVTKIGASDSRGGVESIADAAQRTCQERGPIILCQSHWDEAGTPFDSDEASYRSVTGTDFRELHTDSTAAHAATNPGWSPCSGANARRVQDSEHSVILRDDDNVVPVRCYVYGSLSTATGSPTASVRFETATYSIAEVAIPAGTTDAWHSAPGHLRCGLGAQDPIVLQLRAKTTSAGASFRARYVVIEYDGDV